MKISEFKTDPRLEQDGVWVEAGAGLRLLVASADNPKYEQYLRRLGKPYRLQIRNGTVRPDVMRDITMQAAARHVLLDWEKLQDEDGNDVSYSEKQALAYFKEVPRFFNTVMEFAQNGALFREEEEEDARGNSRSSSAGN